MRGRVGGERKVRGRRQRCRRVGQGCGMVEVAILDRGSTARGRHQVVGRVDWASVEVPVVRTPQGRPLTCTAAHPFRRCSDSTPTTTTIPLHCLPTAAPPSQQLCTAVSRCHESLPSSPASASSALPPSTLPIPLLPSTVSPREWHPPPSPPPLLSPPRRRPQPPLLRRVPWLTTESRGLWC